MTSKSTSTPTNYKQVLVHFEKKAAVIQRYFPAFPDLVASFSWDVSVTYVFSRLEAAKHAIIYCGIVKLHWTDSKLTRELVDKDHMSRGRFKELFKIVYGKPIEERLLAKLAEAEKVRDRISHGKQWSAAEARKALIEAFDFAEELDDFVFNNGGFRPFGDLRGFKGAKAPLPRETTRWVLKGMGVPNKDQS